MFGDPVENPKNWNMKQLKDCIKIPLNSGWSPKCSDDINGTPVFSLANLQDQGLSDEITKYYSGNLPKKGLDLEIGDLLISRSNTVELVGRIGRYNGKPEKVLYPDLMIRIRLNENFVNALFFEKCMQLNSTRKLIQKVSHGTSGSMVKISQSSLLKLPVILPSIGLQQKFAEICNQIEITTESQKQSSLEINTLFDALMQKAFTGELVS
jgi:type I restriction enzyme S subunit